MARDARFETTFGNTLGLRPHDYARNFALATARTEKPDWTIQLDNDVAPTVSPLDLIADAPSDADVIGVRYGIAKPSSSAGLWPEGLQFVSGNYEEVPAVAGGVLCIRSTVWQKIPRGPWFQIAIKQGSELLEWASGEDCMFCQLVRSKGMKVYVHKTPADHFHSVNLTEIAMM